MTAIELVSRDQLEAEVAAQLLLQSGGSAGKFFPAMKNVDICTGLPSYAYDYNYLQKGVLYLGPIYMIGAHLIGIGLDNSNTSTGNIDDVLRFGIYEIIEGVPQGEPVLDAGVIDTGWDEYSYKLIEIDFNLDPNKFYAAAMVNQGPNDDGPPAYNGQYDYLPLLLTAWYQTPESMDQESGYIYMDWYGNETPDENGYIGPTIVNEGSAYGIRGWVYNPENGVMSNLPELPDTFTGFKTNDDGRSSSYLGYGYDGGYAPNTVNLRTGD